MNTLTKKLLVLGCAGVLAVALAGCASGEAESPQTDGGSNAPEAQEEQKQPLDLTGEWKQVNSNAEDSYQVATIGDGVIVVNWVGDGGDTKSLYWAGTYVAPTEPADSYTWESQNDTAQTANALMASGDETKTFAYENGQISYELTALGTTMTVKMERQ